MCQPDEISLGEKLKRNAEMRKAEMMKVEGVDGLGIPFDK
jgi:hypothetical protein